MQAVGDVRRVSGEMCAPGLGLRRVSGATKRREFRGVASMEMITRRDEQDMPLRRCLDYADSMSFAIIVQFSRDFHKFSMSARQNIAPPYSSKVDTYLSVRECKIDNTLNASSHSRVPNLWS